MTAPAADRQAAYVGIARADAGMIAAVRLEDGHLLWRVPVRGRPAAVSTVPGAVIVATSEGRLLALSADRGAVLWAAETARPYEAVNGAPAHGGAFGPAPLAAADGMIFAVSGYALAGGRAGNVLLAFAPE